jgi:hypothetical protein
MEKDIKKINFHVYQCKHFVEGVERRKPAAAYAMF